MTNIWEILGLIFTVLWGYMLCYAAPKMLVAITRSKTNYGASFAEIVGVYLGVITIVGFGALFVACQIMIEV
jgi:hypothetical protein